MNKKKILKLLVASSTIAGGIGLTTNVVQATEVNNDIKKDGLTQDKTRVSQRTLATIINVNNNLNVRLDAGINYDTIGYVCNNDEVEILSEKEDWYRISFNGREGYVSKKYVSIKGEDEKTKNTTEDLIKKGKVVNINSTLNIRQAAEANSSILGTLKNGDIFEIISKSGEWYNIKSNNIVGFIKASYVQEITGNKTTIENVIETITEDYQENTYESKAPTEKGVVINISSNLRVRIGASTSSATIGYLLNGQAVSIKGEVSGWYKIDFNGREGYVSKEYIQKGSSHTPTISNTSASGLGKVINISSSLNIRSGAGIGYSIVGALYNGATVNIIEKVGDWYHINHNEVNGYVSAQYLQEVNANEPEQTPEPTPVSKAGKVVNISSSLNIRSGAGTGHSIVGTLHNGAIVNIIEKSGDWYHINHNGVNGYVSAQYLQEVSSGNTSNENTPAPAPTPTPLNKTGKVVNISSSLNIRSGAGTGHSIVGTLHNGATVNIVEKSGDWYHISHNGVNGYVSAQYLQEISSGNSANGNASGKGYVYNITSNLRVRAAASTNSLILGYLSNGESVDIVGSSNGWIHINYKGTTAYVSSEYIRIGEPDSSSVNSSAIFNRVYNIMKAHIGSPYIWGGSGEYLTTSSLNSLKARFPGHNYSRAERYVNQGYRAFDCSGLMQWGFRQVGINIGRTTYDQIYNGHEVSLSSLQPGDLLFYSDLGHVGMYIGNGQWIEAPNSNSNVRVVSVPWSKITRARRVIG